LVIREKNGFVFEVSKNLAKHRFEDFVELSK